MAAALVPRRRPSRGAVRTASGCARRDGSLRGRLFRGPRHDRAGALVSAAGAIARVYLVLRVGIMGSSAIHRGVRIPWTGRLAATAMAGPCRRILVYVVAGRTDLPVDRR